MTTGDNDGLGFQPVERLPWLEPIEDVPEPGTSTAKLIGLVIAGLIGIGAIVGGLWWLQNNGGNGRGELIAAEDGPYKVPAKAEPGRFDGDGTVAVAAAEGVQPVGTVDPARLPEQPVPPAVAGGATPKSATAPKNAAAPAAKAAPARPAATRSTATAAPGAATPAATATGTGTGTVQLGAFASESTAARAWDGLKTRFEWLAPVNRSIVPAEVNGRTVYRLRAAAGSNSAATTLCNRLRVAGENCIVLP